MSHTLITIVMEEFVEKVHSGEKEWIASNLS